MKSIDSQLYGLTFELTTSTESDGTTCFCVDDGQKYVTHSGIWYPQPGSYWCVGGAKDGDDTGLTASLPASPSDLDRFNAVDSGVRYIGWGGHWYAQPVPWTDDSVILAAEAQPLEDITAGDISYDPETTYLDGSVGAIIQETAEALDALDSGDVPFDDEETYPSSSVGWQVRTLKSQISEAYNGYIAFGRIDTAYISSTNGSVITAGAGGWSATDFISCEGMKALVIDSPANNGGNYDAFYDENKEFVTGSSFRIYKGINQITIPSGAKYFRLSNTTASIKATKVYAQLKNDVDNIITVTHNVSNAEKIENCLISANGSAVYTDVWDSTDYISIFPDGDITLRCFLYGTGGLAFYDANKEALLGITGENASSYGGNNSTNIQNIVVTPPSGSRYIRMSIWRTYGAITSLYAKYVANWADNAEAVLDAADAVSDINGYYKDKKVLVIGDSISADAYGNYKKWVTDLIEEGKLSGTNTTNSSQHATGFVARYNSQANDFITRLEAIENKSAYDLVIVFGGINDFIQNIPLGGGAGETDKTVYFKPAVDYFFDYLIDNFTQARICVLSPLKTYNTYPNTEGNKQEAYSDYIKEVAKSYCLPVLNLTDESGFCPFIDSFKAVWTLTPEGYENPDGVHPTAEYEKTYLAPMIWKFISGLLT